MSGATCAVSRRLFPGAEYAGAATDIGDAGAVRQAESDFLLLVLRALWAMAAWI